MRVFRFPPRGVKDSAFLVLTDVSGHPTTSMTNSQVVQEEQTFLISGFGSDVMRSATLWISSQCRVLNCTDL